MPNLEINNIHTTIIMRLPLYLSMVTHVVTTKRRKAITIDLITAQILLEILINGLRIRRNRITQEAIYIRKWNSVFHRKKLSNAYSNSFLQKL